MARVTTVLAAITRGLEFAKESCLALCLQQRSAALPLVEQLTGVQLLAAKAL